MDNLDTEKLLEIKDGQADSQTEKANRLPVQAFEGLTDRKKGDIGNGIGIIVRDKMGLGRYDVYKAESLVQG